MANTEFSEIKKIFNKKIELVKNNNIIFEYREPSNNEIIVNGYGLLMNLTWWRRFNNTLLSYDKPDAKLSILIRRKINPREMISNDNLTTLDSEKYYFNWAYPDIIGWSRFDKNEIITSNKLIDNWVKKLLNYL